MAKSLFTKQEFMDAGRRDMRRTLYDKMVQRGILNQAPVQPDMSVEADVELDAHVAQTQEQGGWLDDIMAPSNKGQRSMMAKFLEESEGSVPYLYDDHTQKAWVAGGKTKGDPTIGIGFNTRRPDADELLKQVGSSLTKVQGGGTLNRSQQEDLVGLAIEKDSRWLRKHFKGVSMPNHRWRALTSLMYNSRWNESGPTLIGPLLTAAIKAGDWKAAEHEIRSNSAGGVDASLQAGINARREREANLFRGTNMAPIPRRKPDGKPQDTVGTGAGGR
jgi:GH24 family phage-related lysozyme (muramidase)